MRAFGFFRNFAAAFLLSAVLSGCAGIFPFEEKTADTPSSRPPATAQKSPRKEIRRMLVTAYDPGPRSTGWKYHHGLTVYTYGRNKGKVKKVGITSDGSKAKVGTIAADISIYPYGTRIFVPGYGWGEVHDVGHAIRDTILIFSSIRKRKRWRGERRAYSGPSRYRLRGVQAESEKKT